MKKNKEALSTYLKGFVMGIVDIIPGISGGTMALILGIYEKIISELKKINFKNLKRIFSKKKDKGGEKIDFWFLVLLFLGIITAMISLASLIHYLLENHSSYLYGFFFGLIVASIFIILPKKFYQDPKFLLMIPGFIIAWLIASAEPLSTANSYLNIFLSGAIAICAMILPGISGSFVLLILGKYEFMISALKNPLASENLIYIIIFATGCLIGLLSFVRFLSYALKKHYTITLAILVGFMAGSLKKIWPFTAEIREGNLFLNISLIIILLIIGTIIGLLIPKIAKTKNRE